MKKYSKKKKWIAAGMSAVLVGSAAGGIFFHSRSRSFQAMAENVAVQTAVAEKGDISTTVVGTGNLESAAAEAVTMPSGLKVEKVLVESGDSVKKGDTLATVDAASVKQAMLETQEEIEELDEKVEEAKDDETSSYITAGVSGTVKKIYAKTGKEAGSIMAKKGALLVIQIDDESATEIKVTAAAGTISKIYVSEGDSVSAGDKLFYLKDVGESAEYLQLIAQRQELASCLQELSEISKTNKVTADFDGIVQDVNVSGSTASGSSAAQSKSVSAAQTSAGTAALQTAAKRSTSGIVLCSTRAVKKTAAESEMQSEQESESDSGNETQKISIGSIKDLVMAPVTGNAPQTEIAETDYYTGKIVWDSEPAIFAADTVYTAKVTLCAKNADAKQYVFPQELAISQNGAAVSGVTISETQVSFCLTFVKTEKETAESETSGTESGNIQGGNTQSGSSKNTQESTQSGSSKNTQETTQNRTDTQNGQNHNTNQAQGNAGKASANTQNGSGGGTTVGGNISVSGGAASGGSAASAQSTSSAAASQSASVSESDSSNSVTAFTVSPDESMELAISVDELDILSISEGQSADITFDALEDQIFTGTVASISGTASVNGGVAKYTVKIEVPKDENMRIGMNASATIKVEDKQDILLIPSAALQERGDKTFVYTGQSEDGTLQDEAEVETGLSDGSNVEITGGLSEGDTVYYTRTEGESRNSGSGGFGDGQMPSMPSDMQGGPGGNGKGGGQGGPGGTPPNQ